MSASYAALAGHVLGVYACFLTWGILQERLATSTYYTIDHAEQHKFKSFVAVNLAQAVACVLVATVALRARNISMKINNSRLLFEYLRISVSQSIASPFGYASLQHITFPTLILGKSCKLLPVMVMNVLIYRKRFEWFKYLVVVMITIGVSGFMMFDESELKNKKGGAEQNSWFGLLLVLINLLLDGLTNSWQDVVFKMHKVSSFHMMLYMNLLSAVGLSLYGIAQGELAYALDFIQSHQVILRDLALFALCGALGQVFIFGLLEKFGSLTLTTVTVTRKLFTVLLSLFLFNHKVVSKQWIFVLLVFVAIGLEGFMKYLFSGERLVLDVSTTSKKKTS
jgi:solute carrier family 35 (UDP-galactose transporter), member B1